MAEITLDAQLRTVKGKRVGALRRQGLIPANIYGRGIESVPVQFDLQQLRTVLLEAGTTSVVDVHVAPSDGHGDAQRHPVLIDRIQRHPGNGKVLHVDLRRVDLNRPVRAHVPIVLSGESPAVDHGGVLVHPMDTLEVEALPRELPHEITVDISVLQELDSQITVSDLQLPAGVTVHSDPETMVAQVVASRLEREVAAEEAAEAEAAAEAAGEAAGEAAEGAPGGEESSSENA